MGTGTGTLYVVELSTREVRFTRKCVSDDSIWSVVYSPDGHSVACGGGVRYPVILVWDVATGRLERRFLCTYRHGHRQGSLRLAYSPDGAFLVTGAFDGTVCVWRIALTIEGVHDRSPLQD